MRWDSPELILCVSIGTHTDKIRSELSWLTLLPGHLQGVTKLSCMFGCKLQPTNRAPNDDAATSANATFAIGIMTQQWHIAVMGIVYSWVTAAAMWQNFRARACHTSTIPGLRNCRPHLR